VYHSSVNMVSLRVGQLFDTFNEAETVVGQFCLEQYHPCRIDSKETVRTAN